MFTSQLSNWEPFLHDTQGKHVQKFLKQLGLWARTDQHITNHWIILFLDIQSYLLRFGVLCMLLGSKYLLRRCLCFVFKQPKKHVPTWPGFVFCKILFTQKWIKSQLQPTADLSKVVWACEFPQPHPGRIVPLIVSIVKGRLEGERSPGLGGLLITMVIFTTYELERSSKQGWTAEMLQRPLEITKGIRNPIQQTGMGRFRTAVNDLRPHNTLNSPQFAKKKGITVFSR